MREITKESIIAFLHSRTFNKQNMSVRVLPNVTVLELHGNAIAYLYNDHERTLSITNAGWESNTTKERLNALSGVSISQKNWKWYLNGTLWDGSLIDIRHNYSFEGDNVYIHLGVAGESMRTLTIENYFSGNY